MSGPFLRWVGGKTRVLPELLPRIPAGRPLFEPFIGGGALSLAVAERGDHAGIHISDLNPRLVRTWRAVRDDVEGVIAELERHVASDSPTYYREARFLLSKDLVDDTEAAGLFLYLNRTCFQGLYRENQSGRFNVPRGDKPPQVRPDQLRAASELLQGVQITHANALDQVHRVPAGAVVYLDPVYPDHSDGGSRSFQRYLAAGWSVLDDNMLATAARDLTRRGVLVLVSHPDTPVSRRLYGGFEVVELSIHRGLAAQSDARADVTELLFVGGR